MHHPESLHNSRSRFFQNLGPLTIQRVSSSSFKFPILAKSLEPFSRKSSMSPFFSTFHHFLLHNSNSRFFLKNPKTLFFFNYRILTPCKKSEKSNEQFSVTFCLTDYRQTHSSTFSAPAQLKLRTVSASKTLHSTSGLRTFSVTCPYGDS